MSGQKERIAEVQRRVIDFLAGIAPPGSRRVDVHCIATVAVNDMAVTVLTEDGKTLRPEGMPSELTDLMLELRRAHYLPEQGTWFSARFMLEPGAPIRPIFNYDHDPNWDPPIPVDCWRRDQIVMPRDGAHLPGWLQARLEGREPSYPRAEPGEALNPMEQIELLSNELGVLVGDQAPALWDQVFGYYQAAGDHVEHPPAMVQLADRTMLTWALPPAADALFDRLRAGTYGFQRSTWGRIDYRVTFEEGTVRVQAKFTNDEEPAWNSAPSVGDLRLEVERFPEHAGREWIRRRLDAAGPPPAAATVVQRIEPDPEPEPGPGSSGSGGLRRARVFDHVEPDGGRPSVSRPAVPDGEVARLAGYLKGAPVVMAARSAAPDQIDPARGDRVPLTFHTDGAWVWAGAVGYYLEEHGIPPEPDLVAHARARGFRIPEVDDAAMDAASAAVTGRPAPPRTPAPDPASAPPASASQQQPAAPAPADPVPAAPVPASRPPGREPAGAEPSAGGAEVLEKRLRELGVPASAYRVGEVAEGAWCLLREDGRWTVFQAGERGRRDHESVFAAERQAAAYLLGSVLLDGPPPERPITPLAGEPPLTLFRDRKIIEVPAGTTVDRYGGDGGNLTYAVRTPFTERSLPPDWAGRPYQAFRLQRPLRALTGIAVPWFDQPGGGTAYLFERSVADLVAEGALVTVQDG
ncbi:glycohydrolase toxin TNT-related protein [Actinomadura sp. 21ATH]|uniref:glycohydrolase toxin TNT-related protein n=1 Tax=Actinomadura sp. 21ATH TaxID=1735444 RepID=UPI0035C0649A